MSLIFVSLLSVALLWLVLQVMRRGAPQRLAAGADRFSGAEYVVRLPERSLLDQCLSAEDLEFVERRKSAALLRVFLRARRRLAVAWLRQTRREAQRLLQLHVRSVRYAADLRPSAEAKLYFAAGLFLLVYAAMLGLVSCYGPLHTRRFLQSTQTLAGILARLGDRIAAAIIPARPGVIAAGIMR